MSREQTAQYVQRVAGALRHDGRADDAELLVRAVSAPQRKKPVVFVAGEDKRGKSSLVNALLSRPDLSPVGVEVVTGAPVTFFQQDPPAALVYHYGEPKPAQLPFEQARTLATVRGNPGNVHNVRAVALGVPSPILAGLNLVDTPGVGGLESGHGALTLQSLASADALIFVIEAGAQFRGAELQFLKRASARIETVILVLTKTDLHRGWRTILDDNAAILREQAPRFANCPVVPVSSLLAFRGLRSDDPEDARALRDESGLTRLEQVLHESVVARAERLPEANAVRGAIDAVIALDRAARERHAAIATDSGGRDQLEAERGRLRALNQDRAEWPQLLDGEIRKLTFERSEAASRGTLEIKRRYDERLKKVSKEQQDELPGELIADLTALAGSLNEEASRRLSAVVDQLLAGIDTAAQLGRSIEALASTSLRGELESTSLGSHSLKTQDHLSVLSSFSSGRSLGTFAGVAASAVLMPPFGLALGFALGGLFAYESFRSRGRQVFTQEFQSWMQTQIAQTQISINTSFSRRMIDLQVEVREAIRAVLSQREHEITAALNAAQALIEAETGRRREEQQKVVHEINGLVELHKQGAELLASLRA